MGGEKEGTGTSLTHISGYGSAYAPCTSMLLIRWMKKQVTTQYVYYKKISQCHSSNTRADIQTAHCQYDTEMILMLSSAGGTIEAWLYNGNDVGLVTRRSRVQLPAIPVTRNDCRQVVHGPVPLSPSSIIWY